MAKREGRSVRAFGDVPKESMGKLQHTEAKGSAAARQFAETGETMTDGGNSSGRTVHPVTVRMVPGFQGRSGAPDNQSIHRGKGKT